MNSRASLASLIARGKDASDGLGILFYMSVCLTLTPSFRGEKGASRSGVALTPIINPSWLDRPLEGRS